MVSCIVQSSVVSFLSLCPGHIGFVDECIAEIRCHWHGCIALVSPRRSGNLILARVVTGVRSGQRVGMDDLAFLLTSLLPIPLSLLLMTTTLAWTFLLRAHGRLSRVENFDNTCIFRKSPHQKAHQKSAAPSEPSLHEHERGSFPSWRTFLDSSIGLMPRIEPSCLLRRP